MTKDQRIADLESALTRAIDMMETVLLDLDEIEKAEGNEHIANSLQDMDVLVLDLDDILYTDEPLDEDIENQPLD
jgi:hypothetical protein